MALRRSSRHNPPPNPSTFSECENDADNTLNMNYVRRSFIDTYTIKVEPDVSESCDEQMRNDDTNLQEIKLEPQFCIPDENDLIEENHRAAGPDVKIKTEAEDTAADKLCSNLHHVPFASIDNENLQDEDQLQNEVTSELIIKSENELSDVEEPRDNNVDIEGANYIQDPNYGATENKTSAADFQDLQVSSCACQICGRVSQRKANLTRHLKLHDKIEEINDKGLHECEKKTFDKKSVFLNHKENILNVQHKCLQCSKEFKTTRTLNQHVKLVHEAVGSFCCTHNQCSKSFKSKSYLKFHLAVHSNVRSFQCENCPKTFSLKKHLQQHYKNVHSEVSPFVCKKCGKAFKSKGNLSSHSLVHTDIRPFACEVCGNTFKSKSEVKMHRRGHNTELNFKCEHCGRKFKSRKLVYDHKQVHVIVRKFQCALCDMKFKTKKYIYRHMLVHSDVRPFSCDICAKSFKSKRDLKLHGSIHSTSNDIKCNLCAAEFKLKGDLVRHMKYVHSDARLFKCNECEKSFKTKSNLRSHIAGHLNLRQFKSDKCDLSLNCKNDLKRHSLVHSDIFAFKCHVCERKFKRKRNLKSHIFRFTCKNVWFSQTFYNRSL